VKEAMTYKPKGDEKLERKKERELKFWSGI